MKLVCRLSRCWLCCVQVVTFFSDKLEKTGPSPYSSEFVLSTIEQTAKAWPRDRLRVSSAIAIVSYSIFTCMVLYGTLYMCSYGYRRCLRVYSVTVEHSVSMLMTELKV